MKKMKFICSYSTTIDKIRKIYRILNAQTIKKKNKSKTIYIKKTNKGMTKSNYK